MKKIFNQNFLSSSFKYIVFKGELPDQFEIHRFDGGKIPSPVIIDPAGGVYALEDNDVQRLINRQTKWRSLSATPFIGFHGGKIKIAARMELCTPPGGVHFIKYAALIELLDILEDPDAKSYEFVASGWIGVDLIGKVDD